MQFSLCIYQFLNVKTAAVRILNEGLTLSWSSQGKFLNHVIKSISNAILS
jgi:hypothetical protein